MAKKKKASDDESSGSRSKLGIIAIVVVVLAAGAYFFLRPAPAPVVEEPSEPEVHTVVDLGEPLVVNLADGRYLRVAVALGLDDPPEDPDGEAPAEDHSGDEEGYTPDMVVGRDAVLTTLSGLTAAELTAPGGQDAAKAAVVAELSEPMPHLVEVYFTDFVIQ